MWFDRALGKREIALAPPGAPVFDHGGQLQAVMLTPTGTGVVLALVPDGAADGVGHERGNLAVEQIRWMMAVEARFGGAAVMVRVRTVMAVIMCLWFMAG